MPINAKSCEACKVYTTDDIAAMLGISEAETYRFLAMHSKLNSFKIVRIGKLYRIERNSFDAWLHGQSA